MGTCNLQIEYPGRECMLDQDEEWFHLVTEDGQERIRVHEYDRVYDVPGLYEEVVYNKLQCDSPQVITGLLKETIERHGESDTSLRVLDFGAGNGIVGECLQEAVDTETIVGIDIIDEAKKAVKRDRPEIYDDYYVMDLSQPDGKDKQMLDRWNFNALVTVASLGFGDIPTQAFVNAFNIIENNSWVAFNIKDRFLNDKDDTGYNEMLQKMIGQSLNVYRKHHYCHRLSMAGEPLYYYAIVGRKENDF
ncbi:MAG: class I SAM-dependent methyltransferase [Desulfosarcina sp.]|nr:class I SAM-dependent methyltransferase [Desulfosarcina sp.]MBC2745274.1 class I SAM-dependent methyltransferase [Desulfosarcina sp.]MBC2768181.1 class I SAM-dependent methyltransferase [Desulfosarcina sp.]